jgi:hypothetical protein
MVSCWLLDIETKDEKCRAPTFVVRRSSFVRSAMQIRTITVGAREEEIDRAAQAARLARERLESAGYVVQSLRLALATSGSNRCADFAALAQGAEQQAIDAGFDYVSIGRVSIDRLGQLAEGIAATQGLFASARIAGRDGLPDRAAIRAAAVQEALRLLARNLDEAEKEAIV